MFIFYSFYILKVKFILNDFIGRIKVINDQFKLKYNLKFKLSLIWILNCAMSPIENKFRAVWVINKFKEWVWVRVRPKKSVSTLKLEFDLGRIQYDLGRILTEGWREVIQYGSFDLTCV